jgi:hypothetical protein
MAISNFAAGVVEIGGKLPPASLPPVSTTQGELEAKFAGGKFAASVVDTGGNSPPVSLTL